MNIVQRDEHIDLLNGQENLSVLHISDVHLWYSTKILEKLSVSISQINPELIVLTGDYYDVPAGAHNFRKFLLEVCKKHLVIFIRGNHDNIYGSNISNLLFGIPNCICVEEDVFSYQSCHGHYYNITAWENRENLPDRNGEINILLIHNPEKIKENELSNIHIILAGHLHGGQFVFFKTRNNKSFPGNLLYRYCTDRMQIRNTTLIVSKGLGDTLPLRFNCPKEIVNVVIR